jgi:hypothetical protein
MQLILFETIHLFGKYTNIVARRFWNIRITFTAERFMETFPTRFEKSEGFIILKIALMLTEIP